MEHAVSTKRLVLVAAILGTTVVTVDSTVVNVALPAIADELGGGLRVGPQRAASRRCAPERHRRFVRETPTQFAR